MDTSAFKQVACKCIKRKVSDKVDKIRKEVDILLNLSHVCVLSAEYMHLLTTCPAQHQYCSRSDARRQFPVGGLCEALPLTLI